MALLKNALKLGALILILSFLGITNATHASGGAMLNKPNSVFVSGNYAYVASGDSNALEIIDISNPAIPTHKGSIANGTNGAELFAPSSVFVSGNYAYVTSQLANTLEIVDISDPANPTHVNTLHNGENRAQIAGASSVFVSGDYAYVVARRSQVVGIINISNPVNPFQVSTIYFGSLMVPVSVYISGNHLFMTNTMLGGNQGSLHVFDVSNPAFPVFKGSIYDGTGGAVISYPTSLSISGNYAYITSAGDHYSLEIVNISDPANPVHAGVLNDGDSGTNFYFPISVYASGNYAYVASFAGGNLEVIDISNKTSPAYKGIIADGDGGAVLSYPTSVYVSGNYAYVTSSLSDAFEVVDISDPANPSHKSKLLDGEISETQVCTANCFSNVLFLPGITGSNLFEDVTPILGCQELSGICEAKRWLTVFDSDIHRLYLNDDSSSQQKIYTRNVIDKVGGIFNLYKSFLDDLDSWKNTEHLVNDYSSLPYDWRLSPVEIVENGKKDDSGRISYTNTLQPNETPYILSELLRLAANSKTGKVTVVAHSYGGLIAKELMLKLQFLGKEDLVDKLIFVAVPEVGTPDAVQTLVHGEDVGPFGVISDSRLTRDFSRNLPGVYSLLPSDAYFSTNAGNTPVASFDNSAYFTNTRAQFGSEINNFSELENYLKNSEVRPQPSYDDINHANILNNNLVDNANSLHSNLDSWTPLANTKVIEVAGWGEYTLAGLKYKTEKTCSAWVNINTILPTCIQYTERQVLDTQETLEGDGTVVNKSAHYLSDKNTINVEKWWVDIKKYNNDVFIKKVHKDILEIPDLLSFIKSEINNTNITLSYIFQDKPSSSIPYTRIQLNSPLTLDLYDSINNHTGLTSDGTVEENIPGSRYRTIGDSKYILVPSNITTNLKLKGYQNNSSFSLSVESLNGDTVTSATTFSAMPSSIGTAVTLDLPANTGISTSTPLKIDFNGDGVVDKQITPNPNGEVVYDTIPPELKITFDTNLKDVVFSAIDNFDPHSTATVVNSSITLVDVSGNTTIIPFTKHKETATKLKFSYNRIIRNGVTAIIPNTNVLYNWQEKKEALTDLDTKVIIDGEERYVFGYKKAKGFTTIKQKTSGGTTIINKSGFVVVMLGTNQDNLVVSY